MGTNDLTRGAEPLPVPFVRLWITAVRFALQAETELRQGTQIAFAAAAILADASLEASVGALRILVEAAPRKSKPGKAFAAPSTTPFAGSGASYPLPNA